MLTHKSDYLARGSRRRGFALIEALVAMVIVGFGMLALVKVQSTLTQSADNARQRSEATRLAEEKIEQMRSYNSVVSGVGVSWADMTSSSAPETPSSPSNTTYSRSWTLGGIATDPMRPLQVTVGWQDRTGTNSSVTLNSFIARVDPALAGALSFPLPGNGNIKLPKSRNLNIPIQAVNLGGGQSAYNLTSGSSTFNFAVVFSNVTGYVVMRCTKQVNSSSDLSSCTNYNAYIMAGYIAKTDSSGNVDTSTWLQSTSNFTGINLSKVTPYLSHGSTDCVFNPATDQNSGAQIAGYDYYLCVMQVSSSGAGWSGTVQLAGVPTGSGNIVCRYQYSSTTSNANENNVQPYTNVNESLDQQNYAIVAPSSGKNGSSASCPTGTVLHQTCTSSSSCPASPD